MTWNTSHFSLIFTLFTTYTCSYSVQVLMVLNEKPPNHTQFVLNFTQYSTTKREEGWRRGFPSMLCHIFIFFHWTYHQLPRFHIVFNSSEENELWTWSSPFQIPAWTWIKDQTNVRFGIYLSTHEINMPEIWEHPSAILCWNRHTSMPVLYPGQG